MTAGRGPGPLVFSPIYKEKVWGGRALAEVLGKSGCPAGPIGESWEISAVEPDLSVVSSGPHAGITLADICSRDPRGLLGAGVTEGALFPLLYKFIDAGDRLSVQVHPDDRQAIRHGWGPRGKTEAWYIVDARPGARIIVGFAPGVTAAIVREALGSGGIERLLNFIDIAPGDVLFIPAGTVHAILGGTLLYEVQQSSDVTLRLYDWDRPGSDGRPRELHVEQSLAVADTTHHTSHKIPPLVRRECREYTHRYRVACRYFALEEFLFHRPARITLPAKRSFTALAITEGSARISGAGDDVEMPKGQSVLLPAALNDVVLSVNEPARLLLSSVPDLYAEVIAPLRAQGVDDRGIASLGGWEGKNDLLPLLGPARV